MPTSLLWIRGHIPISTVNVSSYPAMAGCFSSHFVITVNLSSIIQSNSHIIAESDNKYIQLTIVSSNVWLSLKSKCGLFAWHYWDCIFNVYFRMVIDILFITLQIVCVKHFSENKLNQCTMKLYPLNMVNLGCIVMRKLI